MSSTRVDVLVDANVFVYTYVTAEPEKRARALDALDRLVLHGRSKISTQVLGSFSSCDGQAEALPKRRRRLQRQDAQLWARRA